MKKLIWLLALAVTFFAWLLDEEPSKPEKDYNEATKQIWDDYVIPETKPIETQATSNPPSIVPINTINEEPKETVPVQEIQQQYVEPEPAYVEPVQVIPPKPSNCDPNYTGCVPIASDVDCGKGSGNGPAYLYETVQVIGRDIYDLDRDNDGWACE